MTPLDLHMRTLTLLAEEPSRAHGRHVLQGVAMHDGEHLYIRGTTDDSPCLVPQQLLPLALPLTGTLARWYPGVDYYIVSGDHLLKIAGRPDELIRRLFTQDDSGHLLFGFSARSQDAAQPNTLETSVVWFRELVMERLATFGLSLARRPDCLILALHLRGTQRAAELSGWVRWSLIKLRFTLV